MPTYTTIAQRIAEAKRRGCKVQKTVSGSVYDLDNLPLYDPDHDADCKSHGIAIVEPEAPPTRVRCFTRTSNSPPPVWAFQNNGDGFYIEWEHGIFRPSQDTTENLESAKGYHEITPAAALNLLKDWPEGREKLLQYFRDHPSLPPAPPLAPCPKCGGKCRLHGSDSNRVICDADGCSYGFGWWQVDEVRLADHPVRPGYTAETVALFRELHERLGKLLEGKS